MFINEKKEREKKLINFELHFEGTPSMILVNGRRAIPAIAATHEFHMHELDPRIRALRIFRTFTPSVLPDCTLLFYAAILSSIRAIK